MIPRVWDCKLDALEGQQSNSKEFQVVADDAKAKGANAKNADADASKSKSLTVRKSRAAAHLDEPIVVFPSTEPKISINQVYPDVLYDSLPPAPVVGPSSPRSSSKLTGTLYGQISISNYVLRLACL